MPVFFFFNDTATTEIYTLSLHDALPIYQLGEDPTREGLRQTPARVETSLKRSEEHTSELQSLAYLVCRLLLEKKKKQNVPAFSRRLQQRVKLSLQTHRLHAIRRPAPQHN